LLAVQTLSTLSKLSALVVLVVKIHLEDISEISLKTAQCYCVVSILRLASILFYEGYLPFDKSGDWFYQTIEILSLTVAAYIVYVIQFSPKGASYTVRVDNFGNDVGLGANRLPANLGALVLIVPAIVIALVSWIVFCLTLLVTVSNMQLFHPNLNNNFLTDSSWAAALYLESVAVWPQDTLFKTRGGRPHQLTSLSVFMVGVAGVLNLVFWLSSFQELNASYSEHFGHAYPGYVVVFCQFGNLLLLFHFLWQYVMLASQESGGILPS
jgi:hypothetical protein